MVLAEALPRCAGALSDLALRLLLPEVEGAIPKDWIVTVMNPVDRVLKMYEGPKND